MKKIFKRFAPILFLVLLLVFIFVVKFPTESKTISYQFYQVLFSPVYRFSKYVTDAVSGTWNHYIYLINTEKENRRLILALKQYEGLETKAQTLQKEVDRLRALLTLEPKLPFHLRLAEIVALDMSLERSAFWINVGSDHGVKTSHPIIDHHGVVGQIYETYPTRSLVLTLQDPLFRLHVVNMRTDERAVLTGQTDQGLSLIRYLHRLSDVQAGDLFVTSGLGGVFPPGIGVGKVMKIIRPSKELESQVWLDPLVDVSRVQQVFVITDKRSNKTSGGAEKTQ